MFTGTPHSLYELAVQLVNAFAKSSQGPTAKDFDRARAMIDDYLRQKMTVVVLGERDEKVQMALMRLKKKILEEDARSAL